MGRYVPKPCKNCGGSKEGARKGAWYCVKCTDLKQPAHIRAEIAKEAASNPDKPEGAVCNIGEKFCTNCSRCLPLDRFSNSVGKHGHNYIRSKCKDCDSYRRYEADLKRKYNITVGEYNALLALQNSRCAICKVKPRAKRLAVDHNHTTGRVRGLLCSVCNYRLLGGARDRLDILLEAVHYMEEPPYEKVATNQEV